MVGLNWGPGGAVEILALDRRGQQSTSPGLNWQVVEGSDLQVAPAQKERWAGS